MTTLGSGELHEKPFHGSSCAMEIEIGDGLQDYEKRQNSIIFAIDSV